MKTHRSGSLLLLAFLTKVVLIAVAMVIPIGILGELGVAPGDHKDLIIFAPEVWLALLALVFGTLIIVVSIASENTPKLIDLFIGDPRGRFYIWLIMLSTLENLYLQIVSPRPSTLLSNVIFINGFVVLPLLFLLAIPYAYYILKYTKNANVIQHIYHENIAALTVPKRASDAIIRRNHAILLGTINQLHDLLQYIQFKEPKADIVIKMGKSLRRYMQIKERLPDNFFKLDQTIRDDISFRTLQRKYAEIENERTFYEEKVLKVLGTSYLSLMKESHYELASLVGNELLEVGRLAFQRGDQAVVNLVITHFNTLIRFGINQGLKTREIRNVYNTIYHYSHLVRHFVHLGEVARVRQCCHYLWIYAREAVRLSVTDPLFTFMIENICWELKKVLIHLHDEGLPRDLQREILVNLTHLQYGEESRVARQRGNHNGVRLIQIALCLFYIRNGEHAFCDVLVESIVSEFKEVKLHEIRAWIAMDCYALTNEVEEFWEETDQGNHNIYYSSDKAEIPRFKELVYSYLEQQQVEATA